MNKSFDNEVNKMKRLMTYGLTEDTGNPNIMSVVEYQERGADGKTYGIVREGRDYYLKVAPKKDTKVLAEDFDYIGGFMNKGRCKFTSYNTASKHLGMQLSSINEAYKEEKTPLVESTSSEWQIQETKEMRAELDRFNQLCNNVEKIITEGSGAVSVPEAPASHPSQKEVNKPFVEDSKPIEDKDFKTSSSNNKKVAPFDEDAVDVKDGDPSVSGKGEEVYSEKPKYVETGVAGKHVKGNKPVKFNESKTIKLTEEQVLAWSDSKDFMDKSHGTSIGSSAPYDEDTKMNEAIDDDTDVSRDYDYDKEQYQRYLRGEVFEDDDKEPSLSDIKKNDKDADRMRAQSEQDYRDLLRSIRSGDFDDEFGDEYDPFESRRHRRKPIKESSMVLTDFGKHPAFRKSPMTTPPNTDDNRFGRDWNDKSAKSSEPFAKRKGNSAPYTEEVIDMLTDAVMKQLGEVKKKR